MTNLGLQLAFMGFLLLGWFAGAPLWSVAAAKVGSDLVIALGLRHWVKQTVPPENGTPRLDEIMALARAAWPICMTQILRAFALSSDLVLLGLLVSRAELGHYAAASKLFYAMMAFTTAYFVILLPRFAESAAQPDPALSNELHTSLRRTIPSALAGLFVLVIVARPVLALMFGPTFGVAAASLTILGAAAVTSLFSRHYRQVLLARGLQLTDLKINIGGTVAHIGAKLALIPVLGITGAATGTLIGEIVTLWFQRRAAKIELTRGSATPIPVSG